MSLFSPFYTAGSSPRNGTSDPSFTPLFRLLSDWDDYSREVTPPGRNSHRRGITPHLKPFAPKFDFRETADTYELHGELPGATKDNISVDFSDDSTIIVKGKIERTYEAGSPPAGWVEGRVASGTITEAGENGSNDQSHKATVEDAGEDGEGAAAEKQVTKQQSATDKKEEKKEPSGDRSRYWVSERSIGEFSRAFQFPAPVDSDAVTASLKEGILHISVPKTTKKATRSIAVH
ncbi:hypothetical protein MKZ38_010316 [Zalerion maritima]|uniref:SHSP domain-containing protein n=1 Tax=Zalerion maritima TaxID=339359 RepID=A0AAD5RTB1_9PEZI|nr:hypothetical protein MKZ38_010316 [Zalerion maritima]